MKNLIISLILVVSLRAETICITMPNGDIICSSDDGDNTYIYTTEG